jgi:CRISPR-associated endonuclease/helicase Cas3
MAFPRLLAKRPPEASDVGLDHLLSNHLEAVAGAMRAIINASGDDQLRAIGLSPDNWRDIFERLCLAAAVLHDLGKANDHFQGMIYSARAEPQGIRHEWMTVLLVASPPIKDWLSPYFRNQTEWQLCLWTIAGHHPKDKRCSPPGEAAKGCSDLRTCALTSHADFSECLRVIAIVLDLPGAPPALPLMVWPLLNLGQSPPSAFELLRESNIEWRENFEDDLSEDWKRLLAAAKATLMAADVAGSAIPDSDNRQGRDLWIIDILSSRPDAADLRAICEARLKDRTTKQILAPRPFQTSVAQDDSRVVLVRAGCGSGKTLAAWMRAAGQWTGRRVWFCYPTTGTATEGYRDYLFDPEDAATPAGYKLFHSRSKMDRAIILDAPDDFDPLDRIASLEAWGTAVCCCTVDTVLGAMQNHRRGLYSWPTLSQSAFVFDEIHAFDDRLFGALLRFLKDLPGLPCLLMTASLPAARLRQLRDLLADQGGTLAEISGPDDLEIEPRYHHATTPGSAADPMHSALQAAAMEWRNGGKVLWVANTVGSAMAAAKALSGLTGAEVPVYHSRFKYPDRVAQHRRLIEAFASSAPAIAVATQVAEMSLDLSATLLITDLAPIASLIQRLGRLNRRIVPGSGMPTMPFIVLEPVNADGKFLPLPYTELSLQETRAWLSTLGAGPLSQRDLAEAWHSEEGGPLQLEPSAWMDGGPSTQVMPLRDLQAGMPVILQEDAAHVAKEPGGLAACLIPMTMPPGGLARADTWSRCPGRGYNIRIAPPDAIHYSPALGASWNP